MNELVSGWLDTTGHRYNRYKVVTARLMSALAWQHRDLE